MPAEIIQTHIIPAGEVLAVIQEYPLSEAQLGAMAFFAMAPDAIHAIFPLLLQHQTGLAPVQVSGFSEEPLGPEYNFNLRLFLWYCLHTELLPSGLNDLFAAAISSPHPASKLNAGGIGIASRHHKKDWQLFQPGHTFLSPEALAPMLMGNLWDEVPFLEKMDHPTIVPAAVESFLSSRRLIGTTLPLRPLLTLPDLAFLKDDLTLERLLQTGMQTQWGSTQVAEISSAPSMRIYWEYFQWLLSRAWRRQVLAALPNQVKEGELLGDAYRAKVLANVRTFLREELENVDVALSMAFAIAT